MNVSEMAEMISAKHHEIDKKTAKAVIETMFAAISETAVKGEEISVPGFGKFKVSTTKARTGRNPANGSAIEIGPKKKLGFSSAKQLKDALNPAPAAKPAPKAKAKK